MRPRVPLWALVTATSAVTIALLPGPLAFPVGATLARPLPVALGTNIVFGLGALAIGGVSRSGALAGIIVGSLLLAVSGWPAWWLLATTFLVAAGTTRVGAHVKDACGIAEGRRGRRAAGNVVANTGAAALWALTSVWSHDPAIAAVGLAAALATSASDTAASEIGKARQGRTYRLWPYQIVPPGTNGALSAGGTASGIIAAGLLATVAVASGLVDGRQGLAVAGAATIALGTESVIAFALEDTGWLNNDGVNFVSSLLGSLIAIAMMRP